MTTPGYPHPTNNWQGWQYVTGKPWLWATSSGSEVRYLTSHLVNLSGQPGITPGSSSWPGSGSTSDAIKQAVQNYRQFWGLGTVYGSWHIVDSQMWGVMDWHTTL